ncbi:hypothetical protein FY156_16930 [Agrobacterium tumefaciens]|nr:hypothetical protein FY156_16930 [Agrobacterium tumefaciens]
MNNRAGGSYPIKSAVCLLKLLLRGDGGVRDTADVAEIGFPRYCTGPAAPANLVARHASDMNQPVTCGGVAVYPDDIIFGDSEAVIVIPRKSVAEIADEAVSMEEQEVFLKAEIEAGRSTLGDYPPNAETLTRFDVWREKSSIGASIEHPTKTGGGGNCAASLNIASIARSMSVGVPRTSGQSKSQAHLGKWAMIAGGVR